LSNNFFLFHAVNIQTVIACIFRGHESAQLRPRCRHGDNRVCLSFDYR